MVDNPVDNLTQRGAIEIVLTGDVILDVPQPDYWLGGIAGALQAAHFAIGHLEVPHTNRGTETSDDVAAPAAEPAALAALARAGFDAMTLAGNHIGDQGPLGIRDTLDELAATGIRACGAGSNLGAARQAAILHDGDRTVAVLAYNCVGPESGWASDTEAGCAYLPVVTADGSIVSPTATLLEPAAECGEILRLDIDAARKHADFVIVALHKGIVHTPVELAPYEIPLAHLAVDCGADVVASHHAHIVKGIEVYRGCPIFHGLGNGCVVTRALSPGQDHPGRADWVERRKQLFGFEPDPAYELAPFHPQAVNAMLGKILFVPGDKPLCGIVPVHVEPPGRPVVADAARGAEIARYVERITRDAGLPGIHWVETSKGWFLQ